jgi:hypothetical protein
MSSLLNQSAEALNIYLNSRSFDAVPPLQDAIDYKTLQHECNAWTEFVNGAAERGRTAARKDNTYFETPLISEIDCVTLGAKLFNSKVPVEFWNRLAQETVSGGVAIVGSAGVFSTSYFKPESVREDSGNGVDMCQFSRRHGEVEAVLTLIEVKQTSALQTVLSSYEHVYYVSETLYFVRIRQRARGIESQSWKEFRTFVTNDRNKRGMIRLDVNALFKILEYCGAGISAYSAEDMIERRTRHLGDRVRRMEIDEARANPKTGESEGCSTDKHVHSE